MKITIDSTDEQYKAMTYVAVDVVAWIQNAWDNRARQAIDEIVANYTDKQPQKLLPADKAKIISTTAIETAAARHARFMAEIKPGA